MLIVCIDVSLFNDKWWRKMRQLSEYLVSRIK